MLKTVIGAGRGIANPIVIVLSAKMMLEWLGEWEAAMAVEEAVIRVMRDGDALTLDLGDSVSTEEMVAAIWRKLAEKEF